MVFSALSSSLSSTWRWAGEDDFTASTNTHFTGGKYLNEDFSPLPLG